MKTQTQNNNSGFLKSAFMILAFTIITAGNCIALNGHDEKDSKKETIESVENAEMIDELLKTLEAEEFDFSTTDQENSFQIFDKNDEVLFSGSEKEWKNQNHKELVIMKRKAEFLFETNGTKIYKVF